MHDVIEHAVQKVASGWKASPPINIVEHASDLPFVAPADARGAYRPGAGDTFIVAQPLIEQAVAEVVAHEVVAHDGVRRLMASRGAWLSAMRAVQLGADAGDERLRAARLFVASVYVDEADQRYLSRTLEADEVIAAIAEATIDARSGRMRARNPVVSWWRFATGAIAREVLLLDRPASYEEIEGILLAAEHRLRHGGLLWGLSRRCYRLPMTKPMGPDRPARSLAESEALLAAEDERTRFWQRFRDDFGFVGSLVGLVLCGGAILYGLLQVAGFIPR